jgi:hypothetical protein
MFDEFGKIADEVQDEDIKVVRSRGSLALQQTQRNKIKAKLMEALYKGFDEVGSEFGFDVYLTHDGIIFEVKNEKVLRRVASMKDPENEADINGYISIELNAKIKNLDYDAAVMEEAYLASIEEAKEKEKKKGEEKRKKIIRDAEIRATKARMREQKIAKLLQDEEVSE